jgi:hypothetical protein
LRRAAAYVGVALALSAAGALAGRYDLGTLTCDDMGNLGREAMLARTAGTSREAFVKTLEQREFKQDVERRNAIDVATLIYGRLGDQLYDEKAAFSVIKTDCLAGRPK